MRGRPGHAHSPEDRARISRGLKRFHELRRAALLTRPAHVDQWLRAGLVAEPLRPILATRARHAEEIIADLGGADRVSAQERRAVEIWFMAMVAADVENQRLYRSDPPEIGERFMTALNTSLKALTALGLPRRAVDVTPSLEEHIARYDAARGANGSPPASEPPPAADRGAGEDFQGASLRFEHEEDSANER